MTLRNWLQGHADDLNGEHATENFKPIPTATLPDVTKPPPFPIGAPVGEKPQITNEHQVRVIAEANTLIMQWMAERAEKDEIIGKLRGEVAELVLTLQSEKRKTAALELDVATALNNEQTAINQAAEQLNKLQARIDEMQKLMSVTRGLWDKWEIQLQPKKPRAPKKKIVKVEIGPPRDEQDFMDEQSLKGTA